MTHVPHRRYHVFFPLTVIAIGGGLLLAELNWLPDTAIWRLGSTWPVFVILAGLSVVFHGTLTPRVAALALTASFLALCGAAIVYAVAGPDIGGAKTTIHGSSPLHQLNS